MSLSTELHERLRSRIQQMKQGERIASDLELSKSYGVSTMTVRRVMSEMARQGLVVRYRGRGTFVAAPGGLSPTGEISGPKSSSESIFQHFLEQFGTGVLRPGTLLPPRKALVHQFRVSSRTVTKALNLLIDRGYATRVGQNYYAGRTIATKARRVQGTFVFYYHNERNLEALYAEEVGEALRKMESHFYDFGFRIEASQN